jgi:hypothetical protein
VVHLRVQLEDRRLVPPVRLQPAALHDLGAHHAP